jgi:hypothetical protein
MVGRNDPCLRFSVGQKWINKDPIYGTFLGEVMEISEQGRRGTVVITDPQGHLLDTYVGTAEAFQVSCDWQLAEQ